jgi:hypothetical protein
MYGPADGEDLVVLAALLADKYKLFYLLSAHYC